MVPDQLDLFRQPDSYFAIDVRESKRARHLSIHVSDYRGVEVVVPPRTRPGEIRQFVESHRDWIRRAREELVDCDVPFERFLPDSVHLRVNDTTFRVAYGQAVGRRGWRENKPGTVALSAPRADYAKGRTVLRHWLQQQGRRVLVPLLAARAERIGMSYRRVQVRGQRTRWGSYSSSGTLSINYCLLFLPPDLADYLFVHELCHTRYMNHSTRYWRLVSQFAPDYRRQERRLNDGRKYLPSWLTDL